MAMTTIDKVKCEERFFVIVHGHSGIKSSHHTIEEAEKSASEWSKFYGEVAFVLKSVWAFREFIVHEPNVRYFGEL